MAKRKRFDILEHTADIGIMAYGEDIAEAFASAAAGLFSLITDISHVRLMESVTVEIEGTDLESLLVNWLNELVYIFDVKHMLFCQFEVTELSEKAMKAVCHGEKYDPSVHELLRGIKSTTYHMLNVDTENNTVRVIFDI